MAYVKSEIADDIEYLVQHAESSLRVYGNQMTSEYKKQLAMTTSKVEAWLATTRDGLV